MPRRLNIPDGLNNYNFYDLYRKESNPRMRVRFLGMAHLQEGQSCSKVGAMLKVSRSTVRRWLERFAREGLSGLFDKSGRGAKQKLPAEEEEAFKEAVNKLQKDRQGGQRITARDIQRILAEKFKVHYSLNGVYELSKRLEVVWITKRSVQTESEPKAKIYTFRTKRTADNMPHTDCCRRNLAEKSGERQY